MRPLNPRRLRRRQFFRTTGVLAAGAFGAWPARADELPRNTNPRAIFGDPVEPDWEQRVTITVGHEKADLVGTTDRGHPGRGRLRRAQGRRHGPRPAGHVPAAQLDLSSVESSHPGERDRLGALQGTVGHHETHRGRRSLGSGGHAGRPQRVSSGRRCPSRRQRSRTARARTSSSER